MPILMQVVSCVLVADLLSGFFHWLEDSYGGPSWPLVGRYVVRPNIRHHYDPRYFLRHSWLWSSASLLALGSVALAAAWAGGWLDWRALLVTAIGVNANELHKWGHRSRAQNGRLICALQDLGMLQSARHHGAHHSGTKDTAYCVVTPWLNPILDAAGFWRGLEAAVYFALGARPRRDPTVEPKPVSDWYNGSDASRRGAFSARA